MRSFVRGGGVAGGYGDGDGEARTREWIYCGRKTNVC